MSARRSTPGARLAVLALVGATLFGLLGARVWMLQVVATDLLQADVDETRQRTVRISPERGRIVDRDGRILAGNERVLTVVAD